MPKLKGIAILLLFAENKHGIALINYSTRS